MWPNTKKPQNYAQDLKLCPSGKISPKLVTLAGRPPQRERRESEYWYDQTGLALNHSQDTHLLYKGKYRCAAHLLFDWFWFVMLTLSTYLLVWKNCLCVDKA